MIKSIMSLTSIQDYKGNQIKTDGQIKMYLGNHKGSVGVPLSLFYGESPGRTTTQRYTDVIPDAHAARNSSAKPPMRSHRPVSQNSSTSQKPPLPYHFKPHHLSSPGSSPFAYVTAHGHARERRKQLVVCPSDGLFSAHNPSWYMYEHRQNYNI